MQNTHPHRNSGEREGVFSWVVLNQLLGRKLNLGVEDVLIKPSPMKQLKGHAAALVELGGASAQVVIQPPVSTKHIIGHFFRIYEDYCYNNPEKDTRCCMSSPYFFFFFLTLEINFISSS